MHTIVTSFVNVLFYLEIDVVVEEQQRYISDSAYFGMKLDDQDKSWALHKVCSICAAGNSFEVQNVERKNLMDPKKVLIAPPYIK